MTRYPSLNEIITAGFSESEHRALVLQRVGCIFRNHETREFRHYPREIKVDEDKKYVVMQENGQLMGSTLSFSILCIANLIPIWKTFEEYFHVTISFEDLPVLINGDDILFRSCEQMYNIWRENIAIAGFELSLGKNYVHQHIFSMNSQFYRYTNGNLTRLNVVNLGLLLGSVDKVFPWNLDVDDEVDLQKAKRSSVWDKYNSLMKTVSEDLYIHKRFLHYNKDEIKEASSNGDLNLFIPIQMGGMGFNLTKNVRPTVFITDWQRNLFMYLKTYYSRFMGEWQEVSTDFFEVEQPKLRLQTNESWSHYHQAPRKINARLQDCQADPNLDELGGSLTIPHSLLPSDPIFFSYHIGKKNEFQSDSFYTPLPKWVYKKLNNIIRKDGDQFSWQEDDYYYSGFHYQWRYEVIEPVEEGVPSDTALPEVLEVPPEIYTPFEVFLNLKDEPQTIVY